LRQATRSRQHGSSRSKCRLGTPRPHLSLIAAAALPYCVLFIVPPLAGYGCRHRQKLLLHKHVQSNEERAPRSHQPRCSTASIRRGILLLRVIRLRGCERSGARFCLVNSQLRASACARRLKLILGSCRHNASSDGRLQPWAVMALHTVRLPPF
jgi:hypothetical protein